MHSGQITVSISISMFMTDVLGAPPYFCCHCGEMKLSADSVCKRQEFRIKEVQYVQHAIEK